MLGYNYWLNCTCSAWHCHERMPPWQGVLAACSGFLKAFESCCAAQLIIPVATRTQEGAQKLLDTIKCRAFMAEEIALPLKK